MEIGSAAAGVVALRNERIAFEESEQMLREAAEMRATRLKWLAMVTAFKAVVIEGLEVVFIVIAVGSGRGLLIPASLGALAACLLVLVIGIVVRQPLARVPENTLKFCVGVMLAAFGVFWTGEGLGVAWAGADLAILAFIVVFLTTGLILVKLARHRFAWIAR